MQAMAVFFLAFSGNFWYDTVNIISVSGLPDQFKRVILFYDVPKHFLHAFVIIRDGNVDLFHKALLCKNS